MNLMLEKTLKELEECKTKGIRYDDVKRKADEFEEKYQKAAEKLDQITKLYHTQKDEIEKLSIHDRDVTQTVELLQKDKVNHCIIVTYYHRCISQSKLKL
jgi:DNA repair exonuclease SbcCD ATPase subunit